MSLLWLRLGNIRGFVVVQLRSESQTSTMAKDNLGDRKV